MKRILCYGDSNTWGHDPVNGTRLEKRWTRMLGGEYEIIEEGLCARTTVYEDNFGSGVNGAALLEPILRTHAPLDAVVIMLGTNDIQKQFNASAFDIGRGVEVIINGVRRTLGYVRLLVISPIHIEPTVADNEIFSGIYGTERAVELSRAMGAQIKRVADLHEAYFMDAADYASASPLDGIHMDSENHAKLAAAIKKKLDAMFKES